MSKHTPGPWRAYQRADYTTPGWVILWPDTSKPGIHHRRLDSNGGFIEADARLIAAAPDLLKALKAIVKSLADQDDEGLIEHAQQMIDARAAIDKAEAA